MKCTVETEFDYNPIQQLFASELKRTHERSTVELTDKDGTATFTITAEDTASMRAALNGITSILQVYEHGQRISQEHTRA